MERNNFLEKIILMKIQSKDSLTVSMWMISSN